MAIATPGAPPADDFDVRPTNAEIEFYRENGYVAVERLVSDAELEWIAEVLAYVFSPEQSHRRSAPVDRSGSDLANSRLTQALVPELRFPALLRTRLQRNARRYAAAMLEVDEDALSSWGHAIYKAPGGPATRWHQDRAFWEPELDYHALGVWLPMQDTIAAMGAMQFIPGSHRHGLIHHAQASAPEHNLLDASAAIDTRTAVACPLRAGGATFHDCLTLHYTAPNTTAQPRMAYTIEYQTRPTRRAAPCAMPWVDAKRAVLGTPELTFVADGEICRL